VGRRHEELGHEVLLVGAGPGDAAPAPSLRPVLALRIAFDVAAVGDRDHHIFVRDHVFDVDVDIDVQDLGAPVVAVELLTSCNSSTTTPTSTVRCQDGSSVR